MKKLLILAALATVFSSQAATIKWGLTNQTSYNGSVTGGISATLIYLGTSDAASSYSFDKDDSLSDIISSIGDNAGNTTSGTSMLNKGKVSGTWTIGANGTPDLTDGDNLAILLAYTDNGTTYYNLSNVSSASYNSAAGLWNDWSTSASWDYSGGSAEAAKTGSLTAGGGWVAAAPQTTPEVPEPATGALALAGIALLFKRRRA